MNDETVMLARAIKAACRIREESYFSFWGDEKYKVNMFDASNQGCEEAGFDTRMAHIVYILIVSNWEEANVWADAVLATDPSTPEEYFEDTLPGSTFIKPVIG